MQVVKGHVMPRPCQKRRARVAAQRSANAKSAPRPPPPKSKGQMRATRSGRGRGRGRGRGGNFGGRPARGQSSNDGAEEFRSFVKAQRSGNQFGTLNNNARAGGGSSFDPIALDDSDLEEGELTDDGSDMDYSMSDVDTDDSADDMIINLREVRPRKARPRRAEVMFTALEAVSIYDTMHQAGFPLAARKMGRFDASGEVVEVEIEAIYTNNHHATQNSHIKFTEETNAQASTRSAGDHSTRSSAYVSDFPRGQRPAVNNLTNAAPRLPDHDFVQDYVFDWGRYKNSHISDVPESYLRTIGGQSFIFDGRHPGLKEAFDHHRPELRKTVTNPQPPTQAPVQAPRRTRGGALNGASPSEKYKFPKGAFKGKRLDEVDENYIKTLEGMPTVVHSWPGLKEALADFNGKTGRQGRVYP
ncbi:hypothetical protein BU25DRAFT_61229 [Macroventuria anomochaeta]|uniref:Uncharacterized protein n=1 Tax=Macroventuria anomochaeta TaxID=301207 RepID=A0ACB6RZI2_9PLEO|nr:uncharacterized protein BU25DRAFT_61229 [Macroventuria anomochaeta]KAF2627311.1 hypothetical protein BU25DRAFT_61229 [Macroventuria anomochaeta]